MKILQIFLVSVLITAGTSHASMLVDTGMPDTRGINLGFSSFFATEGVQFTTDSEVTVTSMQSVFSHAHQFLTPTDVVVHGGIAENDTGTGSNIPGSMLFDSAFTVSQGNTPNWYGPTDVSWTLGPGTYWATFWLTPASCSNCGVASYINPPSGLSSAKGTSENTGIPHNWIPIDDSWGLQITTVPVPTALWLFGSGLLGLVGIARQRKV